MKDSAVRVVSAALVFAMAISFAACDKKGGGTDPQNQNQSQNINSRVGKKIVEDSPWYNSVKTEITPQIGASKVVKYTTSVLAGADDKNIVIYSFGDIYSTPGVIWMGQLTFGGFVLDLLFVAHVARFPFVFEMSL